MQHSLCPANHPSDLPAAMYSSEPMSLHNVPPLVTTVFSRRRIPGMASQLVSLAAPAVAAPDAEELEVPAGIPDTPRTQDFLGQLQEQYRQEVQKLNAMEEEHRDKWMRTLQVPCWQPVSVRDAFVS
jgi:hypothetical protein